MFVRLTYLLSPDFLVNTVTGCRSDDWGSFPDSHRHYYRHQLHAAYGHKPAPCRMGTVKLQRPDREVVHSYPRMGTLCLVFVRELVVMLWYVNSYGQARALLQYSMFRYAVT
jgi:hypothetical protein